MTVARSDFFATAARSVMISSPTAAPAPTSESSESSGASASAGASICHTCASAGTRSRNPSITCPKAADSTKHARAPELLRIHSACSPRTSRRPARSTAPAAQIA